MKSTAMGTKKCILHDPMACALSRQAGPDLEPTQPRQHYLEYSFKSSYAIDMDTMI